MKIIAIITTVLITNFLGTHPVFAASPAPGSGTDISTSLSDFNSDIGLNSDLTSINGIISTLLPTAIILGGIILLFMLISGGFTMMTSISDPKGADAGKQRITISLTGFFLLFAAYWIIQLLEMILGVTILG